MFISNIDNPGKAMERRGKLRTDTLFLIPAMVFVLMSELVPIVYTTYLGFMDWDIINPPKWAGISNYVKVFSTPELINALKNTIYWVLGTLIFAVAFPLFIAALLNRVKRRTIFKLIFFIPSTLSPTVAAIFWRRTLASQKGALVSLLDLFGVQIQPILTNPQINTFVMIGVWVWQFFGINLILFLVGLETIPQEPVEAAMIDGANPRQAFFRIILPLLKPISMLVIANALINSIRMFDIPWVMIQGGPGRASETLAISLYRESFLLFKMGLGSAIAVVISIMTLLASYRYILTLGKGRRA
ncbi:MAG: sugar ABC transporter permease [Spirochaetes bacterium]|nr:MAG: sugar ABC transporter permease [Spirochaetota bacterium]